MKTLTIILIILVIFLAGVIFFYGIRFYHKVQISKVLISQTKPFQILSDDHSKTILVLGDSTAVGVGASKSEDSVAGLTAAYIGATYVENRAVSGALIKDLTKQIKGAKLTKYDLIIIMVGGNDIIRFHSADKIGGQLSTALKSLPQSNEVIVMTAGDVGGSTLFPPFLNYFYTRLNAKYHIVFQKVAEAGGAKYINIYRSLDSQASSSPDITAIDGLHPSSAGYRDTFERMLPVL